MPAASTVDAVRRFPGSMYVRLEIFAEYNAGIVRSLAAAGFKYVFLLGDHGGDQAPLEHLAPRLDAELRSHGVRLFFIGGGYAKSTAQIAALAKSPHLMGAGPGGLWATAAARTARPPR